MRSSLLIFTILLFFSCNGVKAPNGFRLNIKSDNVEKVSLECLNKSIVIDKKTSNYLVKKINSAKCVGPLKGIVMNNLNFYLKNGDSINLRIVGHHFKWNKSADWAFELDVKDDYLKRLCNENK